MISALKLNEHNKTVYLELLKDMLNRKDGIFNCSLQMSAGEIVSYVIMDNVPPTEFEDEPGIVEIHSPTGVVGAEVTIRHSHTNNGFK